MDFSRLPFDYGKKDPNSMSLMTLVSAYLRYYAEGTGHTAKAKRLDVDLFVKFLTKYRGYSSSDKLQVSDWDHSSVERFIDSRLREGESPATVARRLATIKHMGRTLADKIPNFSNPAKDVKTPKLDRDCPKAVPKDEILKIRSRLLDEKTSGKLKFKRFRNWVLFELLLDTGLRADEVRVLRRGQLDDSLEWIQGVCTKGKKFRNVYITSFFRPLLKEYLDARHKELMRYYLSLPSKEDKALPLFISGYSAEPGKPETFRMGAKTIWRAINELSVGTSLHPHLLRHSYAHELLEHSRDIRLVAQALGHSDVRITMRYTERKEEEIAKALEDARKISGKTTLGNE